MEFTERVCTGLKEDFETWKAAIIQLLESNKMESSRITDEAGDFDHQEEEKVVSKCFFYVHLYFFILNIRKELQ